MLNYVEITDNSEDPKKNLAKLDFLTTMSWITLLIINGDNQSLTLNIRFHIDAYDSFPFHTSRVSPI